MAKLKIHSVDQIDAEAIRLWNNTHHSLTANEKEGAPGASEPRQFAIHEVTR